MDCLNTSTPSTSVTSSSVSCELQKVVADSHSGRNQALRVCLAKVPSMLHTSATSSPVPCDNGFDR